MKIVGTHHISLHTPNFEAMKAFYTGSLGFPVAHAWPAANIVFIDLGNTWLELAGRDQATGFLVAAANPRGRQAYAAGR